MKLKNKDKKGFALVIALLVISILTIVVLEFHFSSRIDANMASGTRDSLKAYYVAVSGVNVAEKVIMDQIPPPVTNNKNANTPFVDFDKPFPDPSLLSQVASGALTLSSISSDTGNACTRSESFPVQDLIHIIDMGEGDTLEITFEDEDAKINPNALIDNKGKVNEDYARMVAHLADIFLSQINSEDKMIDDGGFRGRNEFTGEDFVQALIDWIDPDNDVIGGGGNEDGFYKYNYIISNNPLETVSELRFIKGVTELDLFLKLAPCFTTYSTEYNPKTKQNEVSKTINVNRTSTIILEAMLFSAYTNPQNKTPLEEKIKAVGVIRESMNLARLRTSFIQQMESFLKSMGNLSGQPEIERPCTSYTSFTSVNGQKKTSIVRSQDRQPSPIPNQPQLSQPTITQGGITPDTKAILGFINNPNARICSTMSNYYGGNQGEEIPYTPDVAYVMGKLSKVYSQTFTIKAKATVNGVSVTITLVSRKGPNGIERLYWKYEPVM